MYSKELLKGTLQPIILQLLKENKNMYGYEITQKVKELTRGRIEITEGALYPTLHKLEAEGILKSEETFIGKRVRKYYQLTDNGHQVLKLKLKEFADFVDTIGLILRPALK